MKVHFKTILLVILFVTVWNAAGQMLPDGPYFGQTPPGLTVEVFGPNLISLPNRRDTKVVFSPDGNECFIDTVLNSTFTFLYTKQEDGHWSEPVQADFLGTQNKQEPFISPDGQELFFVRDADIYVSIKDVNQQWSTPSKLASPISTGEEEWHPTVTSDGTLYFCSSRNSPAGGYNIYRSRPVGGQYTQVEQLDSTINTQYGASDPFIAPDESYMIFTMDLIQPGGYMEDQYISYRKEDDTWSNPLNLGPAINTSGIEYGSYISYDNKYYFFSRPAGWGSSKEADIYWIDARAIFHAYDFTHDGKVDFDDLDILAAYWLTDEPSIDIAPPETPDGIINFLDFAVFAENWGYIPPNFVPPVAPTGLAAAGGDGTISLDWDDNSEPDFEGYNVYRSITFGSGYAKLNVSLLSSSDYVDNTVTNGTIYYYVVTATDTSSNESIYSSQASAIPLDPGNIIIQENTTGFCSVDGVIASVFTGYTGSGYADTTNHIGRGINWSISVPSSGTYTFRWRYSLVAGDRTAKLLVNSSEVVPSISFPATGDGSIWSQVSVDVSLTTGTKDIRLEATTNNGLSNIDYMMVTGDDPQAASCP